MGIEREVHGRSGGSVVGLKGRKGEEDEDKDKDEEEEEEEEEEEGEGEQDKRAAQR